MEWLYRWKRATQLDTEDFQSFENTVFNGSKEDRRKVYRQIIELETKAPECRYFHPHDDWKPKPKEEKVSEERPAEKVSQPQSKPLPHQKKSNLTPGEIEAIKRMRADPNIPEDAKPPLPEGYED